MKLNMTDHLAWFKKDNMILKTQENPTKILTKKLIYSPKVIQSKRLSLEFVHVMKMIIWAKTWNENGRPSSEFNTPNFQKKNNKL